MPSIQAPVYVVMGVSGCGKTTVGKHLAQQLDIPFFDADDFHPQANRDKMASGQPLDDTDRQPWLEELARQIGQWSSAKGAVLACSALKKVYRDTLRTGTSNLNTIFLAGDFDLIHQRMKARTDHYMPPTLLQSQFDTLETPGQLSDTSDPALHISIDQTTDQTIHQILNDCPHGHPQPKPFSHTSATQPLSETEFDEHIDTITADILHDKPQSVLIIPPDITRLDSRAGHITTRIYQQLTAHNTQVHIMPALGTHRPMTPEQNRRMFGDSIPLDHILPHRWRDDLIELGEIDADTINHLSSERLASAGINQPMKVAINRTLIEGGYDLILSIGQVVPHEVIGMANYTKNILIGVGGPGTIHLSHFLGAVCGMESIMGVVDTPVRKALNEGFNRFVRPRTNLRFILTTIDASPDNPPDSSTVCGLFYGHGPDEFHAAAKLSQQRNITRVDKPLDRCVVYLEPEEFTSTWLGNKAIYRTRKAMADNGHLIILAPGLETFGEDPTIDALVRKFGYHGTEKTLQAVRDHAELRDNLSAAAHLIHGSSEGRFRITYATTPSLPAEQFTNLGYEHADYQTTCTQLGITPKNLRDGHHTLADGKPAYVITKPALGLWSA